MSQINSTHYSQSNLEILLRVTDVADYLNISRSLAYQLIQSGQIPSVRMGRSVRVRPQDLNNFINQKISIVIEDR